MLVCFGLGITYVIAQESEFLLYSVSFITVPPRIRPPGDSHRDLQGRYPQKSVKDRYPQECQRLLLTKDRETVEC